MIDIEQIETIEEAIKNGEDLEVDEGGEEIVLHIFYSIVGRSCREVYKKFTTDMHLATQAVVEELIESGGTRVNLIEITNTFKLNPQQLFKVRKAAVIEYMLYKTE